MKALLLKDWYVLRKQVWSYLLIVLVLSLIHISEPTRPY